MRKQGLSLSTVLRSFDRPNPPIQAQVWDGGRSHPLRKEWLATPGSFRPCGSLDKLLRLQPSTSWGRGELIPPQALSVSQDALSAGPWPPQIWIRPALEPWVKLPEATTSHFWLAIALPLREAGGRNRKTRREPRRDRKVGPGRRWEPQSLSEPGCKARGAYPRPAPSLRKQHAGALQEAGTTLSPEAKSESGGRPGLSESFRTTRGFGPWGLRGRRQGNLTKSSKAGPQGY